MADSDAWDADDFEPEIPSRQAANDKWEGEDEDDNVKDNWEDAEEEESEKKEPQPETQAYQRPKKKPLAERIAEKEAQKKREDEEKKAKQKEDKKEMTAEERLAEKIRLKKIQEQESLSLAKGLFGMTDSSIDKMMPTTEAEFSQLGDAIKSKIQFFEESQHYQEFVVRLINDLSVTLGVDEVKKLGVTITSLYHEKDKLKKEAEKKKKKKAKASIKVDRADDFDLIGDATGGAYYDDDDFI